MSSGATTVSFFIPRCFFFFFQEPTTTGCGIKKYGHRTQILAIITKVTLLPFHPHLVHIHKFPCSNLIVAGNSVPVCEPPPGRNPYRRTMRPPRTQSPTPSLARATGRALTRAPAWAAGRALARAWSHLDHKRIFPFLLNYINLKIYEPILSIFIYVLILYMFRFLLIKNIQ